jgi:hypothetical protein
MKTIRPLDMLRRPDKWYLGGGGRLLWAPPFPVYLDRPGFWDPAHYFNFEMQPLFTWTLLDDSGNEIPLTCRRRTWTPASMISRFHPAGRPGLEVNEEKVVLPFGVAVSTVRLKNRSRRKQVIHFIAWSAQPWSKGSTNSIEDCARRDGRIEFVRTLNPPDRPGVRVAASLGISGSRGTHEIRLSQGTARHPSWRLTPFSESFGGHGLPGTEHTKGGTEEGVMFMALHTTIVLPPGGTQKQTAACSVAPSMPESRRALAITLGQDDPPGLSKAAWTEYFSDLPAFSCSDNFLTTFYWYRWYGLRLNSIAVREGHYNHPFVCEGIGYFRAPISYSAFCHMLENRWRHTPELAQGSLLTFLQNQRNDGGFRGYIDVNHYRQEMFYHAGWGRAVRELHRIHPSPEFLAAVYDGLLKYVEYFDRERDAERSGLYDIDNHYETGQEYMHRYTAVYPGADRDNWGQVFRLKGVDVTVYIYELKQTLAWMAGEIGLSNDVTRWNADSARIREAVLARMWDPEEEMFYDVDPASGRRTMVKAATCFYPFLTDIVTAGHLSALTRHLLNPREFWTPFPAPASSADDAMFSAEPVWKGMRMNCPWNGRVWPMTNSHLADVLGTSASRFGNRGLRKRTVRFISRFIRMMFFDGDPTRPNSFEHYNPLSGRPSEYRGIDDYQHSWVNDLLLRYVAGIRPGDRSVTVDPFPFGLDWFDCDHVIVAGHRIRVQGRKNRFTVTIDGRRAGTGTLGTPVHIPW